jgi:hypothetical protein
MNLVNALAAVAHVVGDGKLIPQHAYVLSTANTLYATDGRQWVRVMLDLAPDPVPGFCVRHGPLKRALEREHTEIRSDGANGLIVSYGRGRARLRGIDPESFPALREHAAVVSRMALPPEFTNRVEDLMAFCADGDGHVWQQAVHMQSDYLFASNSYALAKCPMQWDFDSLVGIPVWACKFIANMDEPPLEFRDHGQMISFGWRNVDLFTSLLTQEASEASITLASGIVAPTLAVPDGLKEAVARIGSYGATVCQIGEGKISHASETIELEDDLNLPDQMKSWSVEILSAALQHATTIDLSGRNGTWAGAGYVGIFSGRSR